MSQYRITKYLLILLMSIAADASYAQVSKSPLILTLVLNSKTVSEISTPQACPGCCSSHGGTTTSCAPTGRIYCADGTVSPSCTCGQCGVSTSLSQSITFSPIANQPLSLGSLAINATSTSGLAVTFSSTTSGVCDLVASTIILHAIGVCTINANQAGSGSYSAAAQVSRSFFVVTSATNLLPLSMRGGIDLDGAGASAIIVRSANAQLKAGKLVNSIFQFSALNDPGLSYRLLGFGDFYGTGKSDLAFQNTAQGAFGDVKVWRNFSYTNEVFWRQVKQVWDVQAVGDLDGDGFGDLVWRYVVSDSPDTGVSYVWFTNGGAISQVRKRGGAPLTWRLLGAADLNGDRVADMIYISPDGQIKVLMGTANRTCANFSAGSLPAGFTAVKVADFSGNGRGDILIRNLVTGENRLVILSAAGLVLPTYAGTPDDPNASCTATAVIITSTVRSLPDIDPAWQFYASGDFNADGVTDIVWIRIDGSLVLWQMNASDTSPNVNLNAGTAPTGFRVVQP